MDLNYKTDIVKIQTITVNGLLDKNQGNFSV